MTMLQSQNLKFPILKSGILNNFKLSVPTFELESTEDLLFAGTAGSRSRHQTRHPRIRPPENARAAAQHRDVPDPADFLEELSAGFQTDGIFREYRRQDGCNSAGSIQKIVGVLA